MTSNLKKRNELFTEVCWKVASEYASTDRYAILYPLEEADIDYLWVKFLDCIHTLAMKKMQEISDAEYYAKKVAEK